jgi:hypothetical protein
MCHDMLTEGREASRDLAPAYGTFATSACPRLLSTSLPKACLPKVARLKFPLKTKGNMWLTRQKGRMIRCRRNA